MAVQKRKKSVPVIAFLSSQASKPFKDAAAAFHEGLAHGGCTEGEHFNVEHQCADGSPDRLKKMAADVVRQQVALIAAFGGAGTALRAKEQTDKIPILFVSGFNPVKVKLLDKLDKGRRPSNITGVHVRTTELCSDRLKLLRELLPKAKTLAVLVNPTGVVHEDETAVLGKAARAARLKLVVLQAKDKSELDAEFKRCKKEGAEGLVVSADPFFTSSRDQIVALAARHKIPVVYPWSEYVYAGGLLSYGPNLTNAYRRVGVYAAMILKGAKPADLPVLEPSSYKLVINLKTARKLDFEVPHMLVARANEVVN